MRPFEKWHKKKESLSHLNYFPLTSNIQMRTHSHSASFHPSFLTVCACIFLLTYYSCEKIFRLSSPCSFSLSVGNVRKNAQAFSEISGIITMFYVVRALSPYTEYEFYVIAVNNIGRGPPSIPATTTTGETGKRGVFFCCNQKNTEKKIVMNSASHLLFNWFI